MQFWKYLDSDERNKVFEIAGRDLAQEWQEFYKDNTEDANSYLLVDRLQAQFRKEMANDPVVVKWNRVVSSVKSLWKEQYHLYLQSPDWNIKRSTVLERDKYKCRICGFGDKLQVHHLTYDRVYDESLYDLVTVCEDCHTLIHTLD